jgi:DNA (cytosine-5)-methyltransferase 1
MLKPLNFVDLFSGAGGLSFGFHNSRYFNCLRAVDFWEPAVKCFNSNYKTDVAQKIDFYERKNIDNFLKEYSSKIDLIIGGPPCQGFSTLGKRMIDSRTNSLVDIFLSIVKRNKPKMVILENVKAFQTMRHPSGITYGEKVYNVLSEEYNIQPIIFNTIEYDIAQSRKRYIAFMTHKDYDKKQKYIKNYLKIIDILKLNKTKTLYDVIYDLPRLGDSIGSDVIELSCGKKIFNHKSLKHGIELRERFSHVPQGGGLLDVPKRLLTNHLKKMVNGDYGSGGHVKNIYGRMSWDQPSGTIIAGIDKITCGRYLHPEDNRLLTPRECARIQSYPDNFIFDGSNVNQYYLIGNSVPPSLSTILSKSILISIQKL